MSDDGWTMGPPPAKIVTRPFRASNGRVYAIRANSPEQADAVQQMIENRIRASDPNLQGVDPSIKVGLPSRPPANVRGQGIGPTDQSFKHNAAVVGRNVVDGLVDILGMVESVGNPGEAITRPIFHSPDNTAAGFLHRAIDRTHIGMPKTQAQDMEAAITRATTASAPLGIGGGLRGAALAALSGGSSGAGGEYAKQAGYGPTGQLIASLAAGLPFGVAAGREAIPARETPPKVGEWVDGPPPPRRPLQDLKDLADRLTARDAATAEAPVSNKPHAANDDHMYMSRAEEDWHDHVKTTPDRSDPVKYQAWLDRSKELQAEMERVTGYRSGAANDEVPQTGSPPPPPGPNVAEFAYNKAIADHAAEHNLDPVHVGRLYSHGNDPDLVADIDARAADNVAHALDSDGMVSLNPFETPRTLADLSPPEKTKLAGDIEKVQEPFIQDDSVEGGWRNETPEEKIARHDEIDARTRGKLPTNDNENFSASAEAARAKALEDSKNAPEAVWDPRAEGGRGSWVMPEKAANDTVEPHQPELPLETQIDPEAEYRASGGGGGGREPPREPPSGGDEPPGGGDGGDGGDGLFDKNTDPNHPINKLIAAIQKAKQARTKQDAAKSEELSRRVGAATGVAKNTSGVEGFHAELGQLKGKMPTEGLDAIGAEMSQSDIEGLFDVVKNHPTFSFFETIHARSGLAKLLGGEGVPTKSELKLLQQVFPSGVIDDLMRNRSGSKLADYFANAMNIPRALMASFDLSAPGRQGIFLIGSKAYWTSFVDMFKAFGSDRAYKAINDSITSRPTYPLMEKYRLALTNTGKNLSEREEAFMSQWAERIPVVGRLVRASDRAYSGYLNKLRADTFDRLVNDVKKARGVDVIANPKTYRDIARFVNAATGRGSLGKLNQAAPVLSAGLFSPRLIASRVQLLNPAFYVTLSPIVRRQAIKSLLTFSGIAMTVLSLAAAGGASVEVDPRSSDFAKIKIGNTRYDMLGGFQQYIRAGAQIITGQTKSTTTGEIRNLGEGYKADTRLDVLGKFFQNKLAPVPSLIADILRGKDAVGNPVNVPVSIAQRFVPLVMQDIYDLYKDKGIEGVAEGTLPAIFGVGVQTFAPRAKNKSMAQSIKDPKDPAFVEIERLSPSDKALIRAPSSTINIDGEHRTLTADEKTAYQKVSSAYILEALRTEMATDKWKAMTDDERRTEIKGIVSDMQANARDELFRTPSETAAPQPQGNALVPAAHADTIDENTGWTMGPPTEASIVRANPLIAGFTAGVFTSGRRTAQGNRAVGGVPDSHHLDGDGADFKPAEGQSLGRLAEQARDYFGKDATVLIEPRKHHVHVTLRGMNAPYFGRNGVQ